MLFIFWQNIVSPHHSFFLRNLASKHSVLLIVEKLVDEDRLNQGWELPNLGQVEILVLKYISSSRMTEIFNLDAHHLFSGILSYPSISIYFKKLIKTRKVSIISESPIQIGLMKFLRFSKYKFLAYKYNKHISNIFAMGDLGVKWFERSGFSKGKIHRFMYTVELQNDVFIRDLYIKENEMIRFTYIGQIINRKGISELIGSLHKIGDCNWTLNIIGDGSEREKLIKLIHLYNLESKVFFRGVISNTDATKYLLTSTDYLILPSRFDGWGAVVNESLACGVPAIVSNMCGSASLITSNSWGYIYKQGDACQLSDIIERLVKDKCQLNVESRLILAQNYEMIQAQVIDAFISKFEKL